MKKVVLGCLMGIVVMMVAGCATNSVAKPGACFSNFEAKAKAGEPVTVVFFGGSLTWGANASDPQVTSYRGRMMTYLQNKYPTAAFRFHDAAIGGTGSSLGIFRLDRDVLKHNPDLVFLDFTANDGLDGEDIETLACYEALLRRMISRDIPVVQAFFGFKWNFGKGYNLEKMTRRRDHLKMAKAYHTGIGDMYPLLQEKLVSGETTKDILWNIDAVHPGDAGYGVFFEAVRDGFEQAIEEDRVCVVPEKPVFSDRFVKAKRIRLVETDLPEGWKPTHTFRTSLWFDGLSSRWMGDVAMCDAKYADKIKPLKMEFEGSLLGFFGEANQDGLAVQVKVDGEVVQRIVKDKKFDTFPCTTARFSPKGNLFIWRCCTKTLKPGKHVLEIVPIMPEGEKKGQLRIESICVAGE